MSKQRYEIQADGLLVRRDGSVLGRLVSLTIDTDPHGGLQGVERFEEQEQMNLTSNAEEGGQGGNHETDDEPFASAAASPTPPSPTPKPGEAASEAEARVWSEFLHAFPDHNFRVRELTPARLRTIRKAMKAVGGEGQVNVLIDAILGLKSWRVSRKGDVSLSVIFETGMRDNTNLTEKIEWWASQKSGDAGGAQSESDASIRRRQIEVVEMYSYPDSDSHRERGEAAINWLQTNASLTYDRDETGRIHWKRTDG